VVVAGYLGTFVERRSHVILQALPKMADWGHVTTPISPEEIVYSLAEETARAVNAFEALLDGPEPCNTQLGCDRVSVTIPLGHTLFDQLMNGATGYRAHYSVSVERGESFNRQLVEAVAPILVNATQLYSDRVTRERCEASLLGGYSKFWFPKEISDLAAEPWLKTLTPTLRVRAWIAYWQSQPAPWKGLLVPLPENSAVLLNGTFIDAEGEAYERKPGRSKQLFDSGWT
jgi:hypothetical protein